MKSTEFSSSGLSEGSRVFLADCALIAVENVKVGDILLSADGNTSEVEGIRECIGKSVNVTQLSKHDTERAESMPFGLTEICISENQLLMFSTKQRVKTLKKKEKTIVEVTEVSKNALNGKVSMPRTGSKVFNKNASVTEIKEHIRRKTSESSDGKFRLHCSVKDLESLNKELRIASRLLLCPISLEIPVLEPWLEMFFSEKVTAQQIEAMAWLLGFWIGDGHKRGATFSLHSEDTDVNEMLRNSAALLNMKLTIKRRGDGGFFAVGTLHTLDGSWNKNSPLTTALKDLRFYMNGKRDDKKNVPDFMRTETRTVRECFMAGLIDSDGCSRNDHGTVKVKIPTAFPPIRDGILFIGRSLGLNITVTFEPERQRENFHQSDTWIFHLLPGANKEIFWSILNRCSCERKRSPPIIGPSKALADMPATHHTESTENGFNMMPITFKFSDSGTKRLFDIFLKDASASYITEQQLICFSASHGGGLVESSDIPSESFIAEEKNFCFSCSRAKDSSFEDVPWAVEYTWCSQCRKRYQITGAICLNPKCRKIPSENEIEKMRNKNFSRLCCLECNHGTKLEKRKVQEPVVSKFPERRCHSCSASTTVRWLKLPWDKKSTLRICRSCSHKFNMTNQRCLNSECCKLFGKNELKELVANSLSEIDDQNECLPCPRCQMPTTIKRA